ncbi:MAG: hypothetical protein GVY16_10590 [Planctomycetes bacterium]|jgi:hypothetical protein|nr:hypothetical protein [Planctomycetota bacterium]
MDPMKVIARFRNGAIIRGTTRNFRPETCSTFHVLTDGSAPGAAPVEIDLCQLKAVFVVKSYEGNPGYHVRNDLDPLPGRGVVIDVQFADGETIRGQSMTFNMSGAGFWMTPVDPQSNNRRMFVVRGATVRIRREMRQAV